MPKKSKQTPKKTTARTTEVQSTATVDAFVPTTPAHEVEQAIEDARSDSPAAVTDAESPPRTDATAIAAAFAAAIRETEADTPPRPDQPSPEYPMAAETRTADRNAELDTLAATINAASLATLEGMETIAKACARADEILPKHMKDQFAKLLQFETSKFSKFVTMGNNTLIWSPEVKPHLPRTSFTSIYYIAKWCSAKTNEEGAPYRIREAITAGAIHPAATREGLIAHFNTHRKPEKKKGKGPEYLPFAIVKIREGVSTEEQDALEEAVMALGRKKGIQVKLKEGIAGKSVEEYVGKYHKELRKEAQAMLTFELNTMGDSDQANEYRLKFGIDENTDIKTVSANCVSLGLGSKYEEIRLAVGNRIPAPAKVLEWTEELYREHGGRNVIQFRPRATA